MLSSQAILSKMKQSNEANPLRSSPQSARENSKKTYLVLKRDWIEPLVAISWRSLFLHWLQNYQEINHNLKLGFTNSSYQVHAI